MACRATDNCQTCLIGKQKKPQFKKKKKFFVEIKVNEVVTEANKAVIYL